MKKINGTESLQNICAPQYTFMSYKPLKTGLTIICIGIKVQKKSKQKKRLKKDKNVPNFSLFVAKLEKNNGNEFLQNISTPQYTFMSHRPLKPGFNYNIH